VFQNLFTMPAKDAIAGLDQARGLMMNYKNLKVRYYDSLQSALKDDIATLSQADGVDWEQYIKSRSESLGRSISVLVRQEADLRSQIADIQSTADAQGKAIVNDLNQQIARLEEHRNGLVRTRGQFESILFDSRAADPKTLVPLLQKQLQEVRGLRDNEVASGQQIEQAYLGLITYLSKSTVGTPASSTEEKSAGTVAHPITPGVNPAGSSQTNKANSNTPSVERHWARLATGTNQQGPRVEFSTSSYAGDELLARLRIWDPPNSKSPRMEWNCHCQVESGLLKCIFDNGASPGFVRITGVDSTAVILNRLPSKLEIQSVENGTLRTAGYVFHGPIVVQETPPDDSATRN